MVIRDGALRYESPTFTLGYIKLPQLESSDYIKALEKRDRAAEQNRQKAADTKTKAETTIDNLKKQEIQCRQILAEKEAELEAETQQISVILKTDKWKIKVIEQERQALYESDAKYQQCLRNQEKTGTEGNKTD
ncbi:hypothetical protein [Nostoc sp. 'Lobaria pulmonaria (5183) cyanobiont']|uniref:hypothetical protein n=1 Tax=Nostoc sp. 'Lobaria pulmonaria (5183) cyanobiont' TaxID=1618022 RepID=UPI000CF31A1C|nr:hypothetical protein [Nostoc sp. 'Lobaria pulmonaria (5183) cyanobiont']